MTLPRDYRKLEELKVVLLELTELVCQRCRGLGFMGGVVSVGCQGADYDRPTGFYRQMKMVEPTNGTNQGYAAAVKLFRQHWAGVPASIRRKESQARHEKVSVTPRRVVPQPAAIHS